MNILHWAELTVGFVSHLWQSAYAPFGHGYGEPDVKLPLWGNSVFNQGSWWKNQSTWGRNPYAGEAVPALPTIFTAIVLAVR